MMWQAWAIIGVAFTGSAAIAADREPAPDIRVEQTVYRNDTIVAAPFIQLVAGNTASSETSGRFIRLKTTVRSGSNAASVAVTTTASVMEGGKEAGLETTELIGGIGSGATKTWRRKDGTVYRLVTNIRAATRPADAAPRP